MVSPILWIILMIRKKCFKEYATKCFEDFHDNLHLTKKHKCLMVVLKEKVDNLKLLSKLANKKCQKSSNDFWWTSDVYTLTLPSSGKKIKKNVYN